MQRLWYSRVMNPTDPIITPQAPSVPPRIHVPTPTFPGGPGSLPNPPPDPGRPTVAPIAPLRDTPPVESRGVMIGPEGQCWPGVGHAVPSPPR